jgi:preprotein translocase subunit SecB
MNAPEITPPPPPLQLESSFFSKLEIGIEPEYVPSDEDHKYSFGFTANIAVNNSDPHQFRVDIGVKGDPAESGSAPYHLWVEVSGIFRIPEERSDKERLLLLTGAAMLYGAAREMIMLVSGRHLHGQMILPTVSPEVFFQAAEHRKQMVAAKIDQPPA